MLSFIKKATYLTFLISLCLKTNQFFKIMKRTLLFLFTLGIINALSAQVIIDENFDSYTSGTGIAIQASTPWTTWSNAPGGAEDPSISTTQANSAANSVYVSTTSNDLILDLGDKTTGRYKINFKIFVETGKVAYFNILNDFAGGSSTWAMQTFFRTNGYCSVDAGGALVDSVTFTPDTWIDILFVVDVDDDFATMYVDSTELVSWVFSSGSFGDGTTHKLDALNFYGWSDGSGGNPGYYIDDIYIEQVTPPEAPLNLSAVVSGNDIAVTWDAPGSGTPDSYTLLKNNAVLASGLIVLYNNETGLYPQDYTYVAKAHYEANGYSHSSNDTTVNVAGGVDRNLVLLEIITGTWCYYCPGAAKGADDMVSNGHDVAVIEYHSGDSYETADVSIRNSYYSPSGIPFSAIDGLLNFAGGDHSVSLYPSYLNYYNQRIDVPSVDIVYLDIVCTGGDNFTANVSVKESNDFFASGLKLYAALTESHIPESWQGMSELDFVCRGLYPNGNGTALDFSTNDSLSFTFDFSTSTYVLANCEFVVFVQHSPSTEVVQTAKIDMATIIGIEDMQTHNIQIYPNPASDYIRLIGDGNGYYEIINIAGQLVLSGEITKTEQLINISMLDKGVYIVKARSSSGVSSSRVVIQ